LAGEDLSVDQTARKCELGFANSFISTKENSKVGVGRGVVETEEGEEEKRNVDAD